MGKCISAKYDLYEPDEDVFSMIRKIEASKAAEKGYKMVEPIKPSEAVSARSKQLPPFVIETFNELICEKMSGGFATIRQEEIIERMLMKSHLKRAEVFSNKYLDVEEVYQAQGWKVRYDKPSYADSYDPYFVFEA